MSCTHVLEMYYIIECIAGAEGTYVKNSIFANMHTLCIIYVNK